MSAAPEAKHNFVNLDLSWSTPAPLAPGQFRLAVELLDTESIKHDGDIVEYEVLNLQQRAVRIFSPSTPQGTPAAVTLDASTMRYRASCALRTIRHLPSNVSSADFAIAGALNSSMFTQDSFLSSKSTVLDKVCNGFPLEAARGAASVDEAKAFWKDHFGERDFNTFLVQAPRPKQSPMPWMDGRHRHRFVLSPGTGEITRFIDSANVEKSRGAVELLSLEFLDGPSQRLKPDGQATVVLRKIRYDCTAATSTVLAQARWDRFGGFLDHSEKEFAARSASASAAAAADIDAACTGKLPTEGRSASSVEEAWTIAAASWPMPTQVAWVSCMWNSYPQEARDAFLSQWRAHVPPPEVEPPVQPTKWDAGMPQEVLQLSKHDRHGRLPTLPKAAPGAAEACVLPLGSRDLAWSSVDAYGVQRGALEALAKHHIDEAKLLAAWNGVPWLDRQRFIRSTTMLNKETVQQRKEVLQQLFERAGVSGADAAVRDQVEHYFKSQARIENG